MREETMSTDTKPAYRKLRAVHWACACQRCGYEWEACVVEKPERCAKCRARFWIQKDPPRRGRPPKAAAKK